MAILATTVWEIRTAGNDTNGGGFDTSVAGTLTDYSQQDSKNTVGSDISTTDVVANGTTTLTSGGASFTTAVPGNIIYLQGGTGSLAATRRRIVSRTNSTTIVVDLLVAAGTGITMNIGGAMATYGGASINAVNGNVYYIKSGSYSVTSATANIAAGCTTRSGTFIGYGSSRTDLGTKPVITASGISSFNLFNGTSFIINIEIDGASLTTGRGIILSNSGVCFRCKGSNFTNTAFTSTGGSGGLFLECEATGCTTAAGAFSIGGGKVFDCIAHDNSVTGFVLGTGHANRCISDTNGGASSDGFSASGTATVTNCVAYNNGRDGFRTTGDSQWFVNCIAEGNASGTGFNVTTASDGVIFQSCATFGNSATFALSTGNGVYNLNPVAGGGSFFTSASGGDFSLNNTGGAGAALRAAGIPGLDPSARTTGYLDIGYAQHADPTVVTETSHVF